MGRRGRQEHENPGADPTLRCAAGIPPVVNIEPDPVNVSIDELLVHAAWVRGLARSLVRDVAAADDLVQEAWLAAMRSPPPADRPVRPWLFGLIRRLAFHRARGEARRARRQAVVAERQEPLPGPDELVERVEQQRMLSSLVLELEEPYRSTVLLRHVQGLSAAEIAGRQGVPAGTVRWRLKTGLDRLRERLDERHGGDRRAWCLLLLPLAAEDGVPAEGAGTAAAALTLGGVLGMSMATKFALGTAAVLVLGGLTYVGVRLAEAPAPQRDVAEADPGRGTAPQSPQDGGAARRELPADAPRGPADLSPGAPGRETSPDAPAKRAPAVLTARFLDRRRSPVAGVRARPAWGHRGETEARSGFDGRVQVELDLPVDRNQVGFEFTADGFACRLEEVWMQVGESTALGDVILEPGGTVEGRVVDERGLGMADAWVAVGEFQLSPEVLDQAGAWDRGELTKGAGVGTGADGRFRLDGAPVGKVRLWAGAEGRRATTLCPVTVHEGAVTPGIVLRVEPFPDSQRLRCRVVAPDGAPIPSAQLTYTWNASNATGSGSWFTGPDGRIEKIVREDATFTLVARDLAGRFGTVSRSNLRGGPDEVEFRLVARRDVDVSVRAPGSAPVTAFAVAVLSEDGSTDLQRLEREEHADGLARIQIPAQPFLVEIDADGFELCRAGPWHPDRLPSTLEIVLTPLPGVRGAVAGPTGEPLGGADVAIYELARDDVILRHNGVFTRLVPDRRAAARTAADGSFALTLRTAGRYVVRVEHPGFAPAELGPFDLDPARGKRDLAVRLAEGGVLEGRVLVDEGESAAGVILVFNRGDAKARTLRTRADGTYRLEKLTPGPWQVAPHDAEISDREYVTESTQGTGAELPVSCVVRGGATTRFDVDLRKATVDVNTFVATLRIDGEAAVGWTSMLVGMEGEWFGVPQGEASSGDSGRFVLRPREPGAYRLFLGPPGGTDWDRIRVYAEVDVASTGSAWELDLRSGALEGTASGDPGAAQMLVYVWSGQGALVLGQVRPGEDGRWSLPAVPAGTAKIVRVTEQEHPKDIARLPALVEFTVPAGGSISVDVTVE